MAEHRSQSSPTAKVIPGRVAFMDGRGEMPMMEVATAWSKAGIYLQGAHVAHFQKTGGEPLLFLSHCGRFAPNEPIRGGVPIIFPWFGPKPGKAQHGYARNKAWELKEFLPATDGSVSLRFRLPACPEGAEFPECLVEFIVTVNETLTMELNVTNNSAAEFSFENCLHTYFEVSDSSAISVTGLKGTKYLDKVANFAERTESEDAIRIASEVDRVYLNTKGTVEIHDPGFKRIIVVEKQGSASTVVWNPWIDKAHQMADFCNDEYQRMVCVESGNVASDAVKLAPGATASLSVKLGSKKL
jgi:glucose-6-phosphate 1-epimerase